MGNYGVEYRNYYEGLKNKAAYTGGKPTYTTFEQGLISGSSYKRNTGNTKSGINIVNTIVNTIMLQLVGTIILFLFVFGAKYSNNEEVDKYYSYLRNGINNKIDYSSIKEDITAFKISDIANEIGDSLKWLKDKMETNPLNY